MLAQDLGELVEVHCVAQEQLHGYCAEQSSFEHSSIEI